MNQFFTYTVIIGLMLTSISAAADSTDIHENAGTRAMTFLKIGVRCRGNEYGGIASRCDR